MFRAFPLPIIRSYLLYIRQRYISCRYDDSFPARSGWNWFHPDLAGQRKCPKHVEFLWKNKIWEIRASGCFYWQGSCYDARSHERKKKNCLWTLKHIWTHRHGLFKINSLCLLLLLLSTMWGTNINTVKPA